MPAHIVADAVRHRRTTTSYHGRWSRDRSARRRSPSLVDRALTRRGRKLARRWRAASSSPVADTRLRFLRRVVEATIIVHRRRDRAVAVHRARPARGRVLASSAIAAAVVGFAARQTLANAIAGLLLAITQPLRIGDLVTFEGETGTVEDVAPDLHVAAHAAATRA